jgi:rhodanese-related sulfurtransferase
MAATNTITRIKPTIALLNGEPVQFIDVRSSLEFESEHIENSKNIPLDELEKRSNEIFKDKNVVLVCRSGTRAGKAAEMLAPHGYEVSVLEGGIMAWSKNGLPLTEGKKRLSIERQTQIAIGLILLTSLGAGALVNKWLFIVPTFIIGTGLTYAGLSGTCGIALLIAKAPWNKIESPVGKSDSPSCSS